MMMGFRGVILNALLAASLAGGVAVAQDAPPPPDSQYPQSADTQNNAPVYEKQSTPQYATQDSQSMQQDQQQQMAPAPPPPNGQLDTAPAPAAPDQQMVQDDGQDPSSRVARMQFMDGQVSIQPGGVNDWVAGTLNRPMTTGDNVWTDKDSRAELNVGTGVFRMGAETSLTLANVADKTTQLQLHQGTLNLRVRHLYDGEVYEIDTPNTAFTVQKPGDYRFDVDPNGDTTLVTVWKGEGNATGDGPSVEVREHERARFSNGTSMAYTIDKAPGFDQFDEWAMNRDEQMDHSKSAKYVSPDVIGSNDLDNYGTWQENPEYGNVWVPSQQNQDWQPYSDGNWTYQQPYGWTWIGYEPWGFAPYHYGRWVRGGWGWGWAPGPYAYWGAPYYSPAMVAWFGGPGFGFGWGGGWGIGFGGGWGWCPLGWGEPFHPWYHAGFSYFRNVNIRNTRITNINNYYGHSYTGRYANAGRGMVAANGHSIQSGASIRNNRLAMNESQRSQLAEHTASARNVGTSLRPTAQSHIGAQAMNRNAARPPSRATSRQTVSKLQAPNRGNAGDFRNGNRPSGAMNGNRNGMDRPSGNSATNGHYVPRPPSAGGNIGNRSEQHTPNTNSGGASHTNGTYARPGYSSPSTHGNYNAPTSRNYNTPQSLHSSPYGRGYGSPSYSRPSNPSYSAHSYGMPNSRAYNGPNYGSSSRGNYSAPHYNAPSYGGSRGGYSAPHYSGGGGGHSAPSYHGGGGGYHGGGGGGSHSSGGHSGGRH